MADSDEPDLSHEHTEILLQFQDLAGIDDISRCRQLLQNHNWNIEAAVHETMNMQEEPVAMSPTLSNSTLQSNSSNNLNSVSQQQQQQQQHHPSPRDREPAVTTNPVFVRSYVVPHTPRSLFSWAWNVILLPFRFTFTSVLDVLKLIYGIFIPDPRRMVTDPLGDVRRFLTRFDAVYGSAHPVMYEGTYGQALNEAKRDLKFLLVYLHSWQHQDARGFCTETLCSETFRNYVDTNLLFWAASVDTPEGYRVSQALRETSYPFLGVVVLRYSRMTVVGRLEGLHSADQLIERLSRIIQDNERGLVAARADREHHRQSQQLRIEQDEAYQQSLQADREKDRRKQEERDKKQKIENDKIEKHLQKQRKKDELERLRDERRAELPPEPNTSDPDSIHIVLKLPNGTRLERNFLAQDSLQAIHDYVFIQHTSPQQFQIFTNFPRQILPCLPTTDCPEPRTLIDMGLSKKELFYVQEIADDDESEED